MEREHELSPGPVSVQGNFDFLGGSETLMVEGGTLLWFKVFRCPVRRGEGEGPGPLSFRVERVPSSERTKGLPVKVLPKGLFRGTSVWIYKGLFRVASGTSDSGRSRVEGFSHTTPNCVAEWDLHVTSPGLDVTSPAGLGRLGLPDPHGPSTPRPPSSLQPS